MNNTANITWYVIGTVLAEKALLLTSHDWSQQALVRNPSKEEWTKAFDAPSNPYRWTDNSRVTQ